eukprot:scaffold7266_cov403-Prasinococcus_capsulatus_cf.AAC.12
MKRFLRHSKHSLASFSSSSATNWSYMDRRCIAANASCLSQCRQRGQLGRRASVATQETPTAGSWRGLPREAHSGLKHPVGVHECPRAARGSAGIVRARSCEEVGCLTCA